MAKKIKTEATAPAAPVATAVPEPVVVTDVVAAPERLKKKSKTLSKKAVAPVSEPVIVAAVPATVEEVVPATVEEAVPVIEPEVVEELIKEEDAVIITEQPEFEGEQEEVAVGVEGKPEKKKRRVVTKDKLASSYEELLKEILPVLEAHNNKKLIKQFRLVIADTYRLLKIKTVQKKQKDATNSGFMRPVKPSEALEKFLMHVGEDYTDLTRAHLTTLICKYIKEKDLQNPKDRRIIFPDEELKTLFQITEEDTEPLTYYNIQKRIQPHVSRIEELTTAI